MVSARSRWPFSPPMTRLARDVAPVDEVLLTRYDTPVERKRITRAVRLSHEFELMFYDTIMAEPPG